MEQNSLLDSQISQRGVQEREGLVCWVGLHLDGQRHRHGDVPLHFNAHHHVAGPRELFTCWLARLSVSLLHSRVVVQQGFCLACCQPG